MEKFCEVCGYDKEVALTVCPDTITRCKHCKDKSIFGYVITDEMLRDAKLAELNQINERYEKWEAEIVRADTIDDLYKKSIE